MDIQEQKKQLEEASKNYEKQLKDLTKIDWKSMYKELTRENKQAFWRSFIKKIEIDPMNYREGKEFIKIFFV